MVKISRPVIFAAVLGVIAYGAMLLTEPKKPVKRAVVRTTPQTAVALPGFTPEDMKAHFPRYLSVPRDAFQPKVIPTKKDTASAGGAQGVADLWVLTGVSTVNNVVNALVECASTGESVFLKAGDTWQGLRVVAIEPNTVQLVSDQGVSTRLGFADPNKPKVKSDSGVVAPLLLLPTPAPVAAPAAAVPDVDPTQDRAARRAGRRAGRQGGGE